MSLAIGLVYDLLGTYPRRPHDPPDVDAEYEPEATVALLEAALAKLGHRSVRLGSPHALLARIAKGELPKLDAAMTIAEGWGGRREYSEQTAREVDLEVKAILDGAAEKAAVLLRENRAALDALHGRLMEKEVLDKDEVYSVVRATAVSPVSEPPAPHPLRPVPAEVRP